MEELKQLRRELHQYPEVSGNEINTAIRIQNFLNKYSPTQILTNVGGTGILAIYEGKESGKTIVFRCELDALPIQEINTFNHKSVTENVSHKCGHDGHMAILCGFAKFLSENPLQKGKVVLLFQPAEENGKGAKAIYETKILEKIQPDYVYALHNLPGYPLHQLVVKNNTFTCAVNSIIIKLLGKTSHAGEPEKGHNPAMAISEIIKAFSEINQTDIHRENYCLITPVHITMGEKAYGISAGYGELHFTVRSDQNSKMKAIEEKLETMAESIALQHQLETNISWTESFKANENNKEAVDFVRKAAQCERLSVLEKEVPFTFGEDFGLLTQYFKGAMFGLGAGESCPALHNPDYDFPDVLIESGVTIFKSITNEILNA